MLKLKFMKKPILLFLLFISSLMIHSQSTRTTIADGLATNPFVWDCTCLPWPNDSIIINHDIILNNDFGFTDGAVVINASGSLIGDIPNRNFAFSNSANFINNGIFDVARVGFFGGTAYNGGTFSADSFYTAVINGQGWVSNGDMNITYSYWNTGTFRLGPTAELIVGDNFYNGDSLVSGVNAVLVNDGGIRVNGDFANSDTLRGSGQVCIYGSSANLGVITGTLDMCDNTGGGPVDYNFGTISGSVTTCTSTCSIGLNEYNTLELEIYPNPTTDQLQFKSDKEINIEVYDMMGKLIFQTSGSNQVQTILVTGWANGLYTYRAISSDAISTGRLIKQ
jgi:hypothetical protein